MYDKQQEGSTEEVPMEQDVAVTKNDSYSAAFELVMDRLKIYFSNITTGYGCPKWQITAHRMAQSKNGVPKFAEGHSGADSCTNNVFVYCGNCQSSALKIGGLRQHIVAVVDYYTQECGEKEEDGEVVRYISIGCKATAIYPHDHQCTTHPNNRSSRAY